MELSLGSIALEDPGLISANFWATAATQAVEADGRGGMVMELW